MLILFYNEFSDCNNKSLYIPSVTTLSEKSSIRIIADKMLLIMFLKMPYHMVEVIFVLMVLLLVLIVLHSGFHHT